MVAKQLSDQALQFIARRFKALSEPMRLRLVMSLTSDAKNLRKLVQDRGASQPNVSRHLPTLLDSGVLCKKQKGIYVYYRIADRSVFDLRDLVCGRIEEFLKDQVKVLS